MEVRRLLAPLFAIGVVVVHVRRQRPGRYRAMSAATSSKLDGDSRCMSARICPPSSWKTPSVSARRNKLRVSLSSSGIESMSGTCALCFLDEIEGALDDGEIAETEEVHLQQPERLDPVHLVLRDERPHPVR